MALNPYQGRTRRAFGADTSSDPTPEIRGWRVELWEDVENGEKLGNCVRSQALGVERPFYASNLRAYIRVVFGLMLCFDFNHTLEVGSKFVYFDAKFWYQYREQCKLIKGTTDIKLVSN